MTAHALPPVLDAALAADITAAVDDSFDAQLDLLAGLVREPSLMGEEASAQSLMADAMAERGLEVDRWRLDVAELEKYPQRGTPLCDYSDSWNVVGVHRARESQGRSLILYGHVDVVPTGPPEMWEIPPFEPRIVDGWMHGRGVADMKAGLVANLFAWGALRRAGVEPAADVLLQSVVEEESTGNGALACVARGHVADVCIMSEPTWTTVVTAHVGLLWFRVHVPGRPAHPSMRDSGGNAIEKAIVVYEALKELESEWNAQKGEHPRFAAEEHPVNLVLGKISGGDWVSSVPSWCTIECRVGLYPGVDPDAVREAVEARVARAAARDPFLAANAPRVEWAGHYGAGYEMTGAGDFIDVLEGAHRSVFDAPLTPIASTGSSDARVLGLMGGVPSVLYGPVSLNIHACDEAVELESVRAITKSMALFTASWCGVVPRRRIHPVTAGGAHQ